MLSEAKVKELGEKARQIRILTMRMLGAIGSGHLGGSMSIVELLALLYFDRLNINPKEPRWPDRDRLVLSKGHAGPALYATLALRGYFNPDECLTLNQSGTNLPSHCDMNKTIGIDMTAGSLGQGLSAAVGMALAGKLDKRKYRVYCIVGDGEAQEGQIWEALMFGAQKKLDNLTVFLDNNRLQIDGPVAEVNSLDPLADKFKSFGYFTQSVDGHDYLAINEALDTAQKQAIPSIVILNTIKGKGVPFAEGMVTSHFMPLTQENIDQALAALGEKKGA
ncbi:MAG: transketolase [Planctomycetes bacterium]|nr:transketolase [Planctomycetota bacterium]